MASKALGLRAPVAMACIVAALSVFCKGPEAQAQSRRSPDDPDVKAAVQEAAAFLKRSAPTVTRNGRASLLALALIKADFPHDDPSVKLALDVIHEKIADGKYNPAIREEHSYEAGVDLMFLSELTASSDDKTIYQTEIAAIVQYLLDVEYDDGAWDYLNNAYFGGDTSQSQYAFLGLWSAFRSGVQVRPAVWEKAVGWFLQTQNPDGGFEYHPRQPSSKFPSTHGMTVAGVSCLYLARMHLYPNAPPFKVGVTQIEEEKTTAGGVLETLPADDGVIPETPVPAAEKVPDTGFRSSHSLANIDAAIQRGLDWMVRNFEIKEDLRFPLYYLYGMERMASLGNLEVIGEHDWYAEGVDFLIAELAKGKGHFSGEEGNLAATCFAVMFLTRATQKTLGKKASSPNVAGGLLAAGRGLADNLSEVGQAKGQVEKRKLVGPIEDLLVALQSSEGLTMVEAQQAIIEKAKLGDREELIAQKDLLVKLVEHPDAEVRRTALWALARTEDLHMARLMIAGLRDPDVDVNVEANNALCYLSRRPLGLGLPENPLEGIEPTAGEKERQARLDEWRKNAVDKWRAWYLKVRPYDERGDLLELQKRK